MDELPTDFDVIVIGTGMAESIAAAAASRIGKRVLHLDSSDFYGGLWASFNLDAMQKLIQESSNNKEKTLNGIFNVTHSWHVGKSLPEQEPPKEETVTDPPPTVDSETEAGIEFSTDKAASTSTEEKAEISSIGEKAESLSAEEKAESSSAEKKAESSSAEEKAENGSTSVQTDIVKKPPSQPEKTKDEPRPWTQDVLLKEYRKFNIDLAPKLLFSRGELVELLISSNIARYAEFRCVNRVLTWINNSLQPVPCSRADVFATKNVTVVEKRMLMKLLTSFMEFDRDTKCEEFKGFENKTLLEYLKSKKLEGNLIHFVLYAIAGGSESTPCYEGVERCKRFLVSLGRYGNTPFLWSMYGCGELPQCFCRLCAVFGGVYCLNRPIDSIKVNEYTEDKSKTIIVQSKGKELYCEHAIIGIDRAPSNLLANTDFKLGISRGVFITNKSVMPEYNKEPLTLLRFPPFDGKGDPVNIIELGCRTSSCPKGLYLVHMTSAQKETAKEDLHKYAEKIFTFDEQESVMSPEKGSGDDKSKPQVLWSLYFNMIDTSDNEKIEASSKNIHITTGPDIDLDFDRAVKQGRAIFSTIYPGEEFLPRAPDPEEIIFEGEDAEKGPEFEKNESTA